MHRNRSVKRKFAGGENTDRAMDPHGVDCSGKSAGEHGIVFCDANGLPPADYDFGAK